MIWNSVNLDTGGKKIAFMITARDSLFVGAVGEIGIVESLHEFKLDRNIKEFKLSGGEIWTRRAKTPLFERVALQFVDIINSNMLHLEESKKNELINNLIEMALDLSKAEEALADYFDIENEAVAKYEKNNGQNIQSNAFIYKDPTQTLKEIAEKILIRVIIAYRKLPKIVTIITGNKFNPGKDFIKKMSKLLPAEHGYHGTISHYNMWIKELYDIRGEIEHEQWNILPFEVRGNHNIDNQIYRCRIIIKTQDKDNINLLDYLDTTVYNMATFVEEMVALSISTRLQYPSRLITLPESEIPNHNHYRFVLDLVQELKDELTGVKEVNP